MKSGTRRNKKARVHPVALPDVWNVGERNNKSKQFINVIKRCAAR